MIPYFSDLKSSLQVIVHILLLLLAFDFGVMAGVVYADLMKTEIKKLDLLYSGIAAGLWYLCLSWLFIGDSTDWSRPIGLWLQGR